MNTNAYRLPVAVCALGLALAASAASPAVASRQERGAADAERSVPLQVATLTAPPAHDSAAPARRRSDPPWFFGFLEFDFDPRAPGGVPGFDPWPSDRLNAR